MTAGPARRGAVAAVASESPSPGSAASRKKQPADKANLPMALCERCLAPELNWYIRIKTFPSFLSTDAQDRDWVGPESANHWMVPFRGGVAPWVRQVALWGRPIISLDQVEERPLYINFSPDRAGGLDNPALHRQVS